MGDPQQFNSVGLQTETADYPEHRKVYVTFSFLEGWASHVTTLCILIKVVMTGEQEKGNGSSFDVDMHYLAVDCTKLNSTQK